MLGQALTYPDIEAVDPDFHRTLAWMLANDIDGVLDLVFAEETDYFGRKSLVELREGGAAIKVGGVVGGGGGGRSGGGGGGVSGCVSPREGRWLLQRARGAPT